MGPPGAWPGDRMRPDMLGGPGPGWGGSPRRMRRGDIRRAVRLAASPAHGYEVMRRLEERSGGIWRPSPGSVYPTLQMLEDEGLVRSEERDGTRTYELTEDGRNEASKATDPAGRPWEHHGDDDDRLRALRETTGQMHLAAKLVARSGDACRRSSAAPRSSSAPGASCTRSWRRGDRRGAPPVAWRPMRS